MNFKAKKNNHLLITNGNNINKDQSGYALGWFSQKKICLNKRSHQNLSSNILTISSYTTII